MLPDEDHWPAVNIMAECGEDVAKVMASLSSKSRLLILTTLLRSPASFTQLRSATGLGKTALAHHLRLLVDSRLVRHPVRGRYEISPDGAQMLDALTAAYSRSRRRLEYESRSRRDHIERRRILKQAVDAFQHITSRVASHRQWGDDVYPYPQPCMYLVAHLVCMLAAGWPST